MSRSMAQTRHVGRFGLVLASLLLALNACGGGEAENAEAEEGATSSSSDTELDSFTVSQGGGDVVVGATTGPVDWLPAWVELPNGIEITTQFNNPGVGEAAVMGVVEGESQQELLAEALILVQSSGYTVGEQYDTPNGKGFDAENSSDGARVVFGVAEFVEGSALWSMEFYDETGAGDGDEQGSTEEVTSRYDIPGVMVVTVGDQSFEVIGSCEFQDTAATFAADDARSVFDVFDDAGGLGAVGTAGLVVDGERTTGWYVDRSMEVTELERTDSSMFYEGEMREDAVDAELEIGTIQIDCG